MFKKTVLAIDKDDTGCRTGKFVIQNMIPFFEKEGMTEELQFIADNPTLSPLMWTKKMCDLVGKHVIHPGHYMREAEPTKLITDGFVPIMKSMLETEPGQYVKIVTCTHRGFHAEGKSATMEWNEKHGLDKVIHDVHAINSKDYPDKLIFLRQQYPDHEILLLDDNPLYGLSGVYDHNPDLLIYTGEYDLPAYAKQNKYTNLENLKLRLAQKVCGSDVYAKHADAFVKAYRGYPDEH